ncbi:hypothetical protein [Loigolactobacillus bifermentans]|uniref:Baseplate protein J-like domain-containing protein n=1 Tax=Loigolactobacillus bifermentans DSM 20003 TaxID=1423726 RepID=A0A0R1H9R3_9LACO|nr:hypothetical protein [Loigolactobacillus bifermentans]KRK40788.1 hypothetical protein FC07_GL002537 [Loigolactobacillus bifermentans DSM 20003]QGG59540.1 hypothetical protein LB003_03070 [Loigolactobacillus bifermentans]
MSLFDDMVKKFPGSIAAQYGTNIRKLIRFFTDSLQDVSDLYHTVDAFRSVDNANGKALDALGLKYGEQRGQADDAFYRVMIKSKIIIRAGDATVDGVLRAVQSSLGVDVNGIKVESLRHPLGSKLDMSKEPLAIRITNIPLEIASTEWEQNYLIRRIESVVAAGVRIDYFQFIDVAGIVVKTVVASNSAIIYHNEVPFE